MDELLARATQSVDPDAPGAFWHIFFNLLSMVPWATLFWWNLLFIVVGAWLGSRRGRLAEGIVWAAVLGPIGWIVVLVKPRVRQSGKIPPLPR